MKFTDEFNKFKNIFYVSIKLNTYWKRWNIHKKYVNKNILRNILVKSIGGSTGNLGVYYEKTRQDSCRMDTTLRQTPSFENFNYILQH